MLRALPVLLLAACAAPQFVARATLMPHRFESKMLDDARDNRRFDAMAPESAAMIVGGPSDPKDVAQAILTLRTKLAPVIAQAKATPEATRPRRLLELLFDAGVLVRYVGDATALYDVVATGHYNCVSSAIVYAIAANELGIDARPFVMPEHARITVHQGERAFVVETTIRDGFDPPAEVQQEVRRLVRNSQVDDLEKMDPNGEEVDFIGLLGFVYTNIAFHFADHGDNAMTEALLERGEALMPDNGRPLVREQLATYLTWRSLADTTTVDVALEHAAKALRFAQREKTKQIIGGNVAYLVNRELRKTGPLARISGNELAAWEQRLAPFGRYKLLPLAEAQIAAGRFDDAEASIDVALKTCAGDECKALTLLDVWRLTRVSVEDGVRAADRFFRRYSLSQLPADEHARQDVETLASNHLISLGQKLECAKLQTAAKTWSTVLSAAKATEMAERCYHNRGYDLLQKKDFVTAANELRGALKQFEKSKGIKGNLLVAVVEQANALLKDERCAEARPLLEEGRRLDPSDKWFAETLKWCERR